MTSKEFKMDVVVPHLNYEGLYKSLKALREHTPPENIGKVILIDQNSTYQKVDEFVDIHIYTKWNFGFAKAMNMGIRLSDADFVLCMNDDVEMIHPKWIGGIVETFNRYGKQALGVNPSSPRNPRASGAEPIYAKGWDYKEKYTEEEYDRMVKEVGKGHIIDGICTWATIFNREKLDLVRGSIPGKCWFDEWFFSGGEDYDINRRGYMTKRKENDFKGYRMLGTGLSFAIHHWYSTKNEKGEAKVKHCGRLWPDKWGVSADIYGKIGKQMIPMNKIRPLEDCK